MQDLELRRLWEELNRQRKDLDWILSILSQHGTLRPIKNPHQLFDRVYDLEQAVAALKRSISDQKQAQPAGSESPPRRTFRRLRQGGTFLARTVRRPLEFLLRRHPPD
jgi:hypothetical protein